MWSVLGFLVAAAVGMAVALIATRGRWTTRGS
jgi:hypothetical protein